MIRFLLRGLFSLKGLCKVGDASNVCPLAEGCIIGARLDCFGGGCCPYEIIAVII